VAAVASVAALSTLYRGIITLRRLEVVEAARDDWRRPVDVVRSLDVAEGAVVAEIGCGAGYFALKLSRAVGPRGWVLAEDVRWLPLLFLRVRTVLQGRRNLRIVRGSVDDPRLPAGGLDAVLIANTYHELTDPRAILDRSFRALRPAGRLVVVDPSTGGGRDIAVHHRATPDEAEGRLRQAGFVIAHRDDRFIADGGGYEWWLIVARKP